MSETKQKDVKPIETYYKGYKFRSRNEARWAVFFDALGIRWLYEPEGLNINGIKYLPDFYLPESKSYFEAKGLLSEDDERKVNALIKAGEHVTLGYMDFSFQSCDRDWWDATELSPKENSFLAQCTECRKYWFLSDVASYKCPCCGAYDGDHYIVFRLKGDLTDYDAESYQALNIARQARFEHGQQPATIIEKEWTYSEAIELQEKCFSKIILNYCQDDYAFGGNLNLCSLDVVKGLVHPMFKEAKLPQQYWGGYTTVTNFFRNKRWSKILSLMEQGYDEIYVRKNTKFNPQMIAKVYASPETYRTILIKEAK